ncbi:hypothetical protein SESBI_26569 [Sesbania bispinosa]|nr:hypothetical protein SESBI_26569 [Sesbania bispinosa]
MKVSGFCALFLVVATTLTFFSFLSPTGASCFPDLVATSCDDDDDKITLIAGNRKLKENGNSIRSNNKGDVTLEDYRPIDPSPCTSSSLHPGPIEHGTPLNPFIPKPSPPNAPPRPEVSN